MRMFLIGAGCLVLSACAPPAPVSNPQGVGFGQPGEQVADQAARARALETGPANADGVITLDELSAVGIGPQPSRATAPAAGTVDTAGVPLDATGRRADGRPAGFPPGVDPAIAAGRIGGLEASPTNAAPAIVGTAGLSNEQDFDAVSAQRSIESDAERQARLAANYQVVTPGALPDRGATEAGPNIVAYALQTSNVVGQQVHRRFAPNANRAARTCAAYPSADAAQRDFLARGGPERDRLGIDPDGDGFACRWDPAPFRAIRGG